MSKIFQPPYTLTLWQMVGVKVSLLCIGMAIGSYWYWELTSLTPLLAIVGIVIGVYTKISWLLSDSEL